MNEVLTALGLAYWIGFLVSAFRDWFGPYEGSEIFARSFLWPLRTWRYVFEIRATYRIWNDTIDEIINIIGENKEGDKK